MGSPKITDPDVLDVLDRHSPPARRKILDVRALVYLAEAAQPDIGSLVETLKWGQISFLPSKARVGTTVRFDAAPATGIISVYFHCQTRLLDAFRERYPDSFTYVGNRAIALDPQWKARDVELRHCIGLALTYHQWK